MTTESLSFMELILVPTCRTSVLIAGVFLLRCFLGNRISPAWRHILWGIVPLALLPITSVPSSLSVYNLLPQTESVVELGAGSGDPIAVPAEIRPIEFIATEVPVSRDTLLSGRLPSEDGVVQADWKTIFAVIWLCGCGVMTVLFFRQTTLCRHWITQGNPVRNERVLTIFESCRHRMKVDTWLVIAESKAVAGPFLIGVIRPTLLLPHGMIESASEKQLQTVFLHELSHLRRWDVWTGWVMTALLVVHWFNPLLWLAIRRMNADREEACDALALETLSQNDRHDYARSLLDITSTVCKIPNLR